MNDHQVCQAVRAGKDLRDFRDLQRTWERGLIDLAPSLTAKGIALLDGIEPTAASGWHMGGAEPVGDWIEVRRTRREAQKL
ncbi:MULTISPECIES: hypothetical protein [unclassified Mesorhizobium]|uniref:hypothetical protein n=1 Tax=unclassified Mesorhizobium TaxID=325217 RepID=UPI000FCBEE9A|nr:MULTISPECIES: hypothetical protein [unclassified Mesorhizobium]RUV23454.1 hypothetical protein EOA91_13490 [Mesorhizobium sp. M1A.F.Ca.IN.022.04.1.1]RWG29757.1 MAG: hypothetical protein EOQ60_20485 [Mesorhizobium sp.]